MIDTWYGRFAEDIFEHLTEPNHVRMQSPSGQTPTYSGPRPLISPYGPNYSMHPELSRPAIGMISSAAAIPVFFFGSMFALFELNRQIIMDAPQHEQPGLWRMFSSALTGTWGGDYSGLL